MRLIDADALMQKAVVTFYTTNYFSHITKMIDDAPTVKAEPKTGKWIPASVSSGRDSWECSVCGRRAREKTKNLPYCHCGAKMSEIPTDSESEDKE